MCTLGIPNFGNNCYINAVLQVFRYLKPVSRQLYDVYPGDPLLDSFLTMLYNRDSASGTADLKHFLHEVEAVGVDPYSQGDAHEFYLTMMDRLEQYIPPGHTCSTLRCACGHTLRNTEPFLSISINGDVVEGIRAYQEPEQVDAVCESCGTVGLTKQLSVHPATMCVIHLKRFDTRAKLDYMVTLPRTVVVGGKTLKLVALCNHHGNIFGGHYTACAVTSDGWHVFNDEVANKIDGLPQKSRLPYLLFYIE